MNLLNFIAISTGNLNFEDRSVRCALGKGGTVPADEKREGDGASPLGTFPLLRVLYRADRIARPETTLACIPLKQSDGWCDDPGHPLYNRPVALPFGASHEALWRDDHAYDIIVELGHNSHPVVPDKGSAIFFHLAQPDYRPTEGCVAISYKHMLSALAAIPQEGADMTIRDAS